MRIKNPNGEIVLTGFESHLPTILNVRKKIETIILMIHFLNENYHKEIKYDECFVCLFLTSLPPF